MEKYLINKNNTVREAITKMEKGLVKGLVVVEEDNRVIGIFTNGDMRVFFLKGGKLSDPVLNAMNKTPQLYHSDEEVMEERKNRLKIAKNPSRRDPAEPLAHLSARGHNDPGVEHAADARWRQDRQP